MNWQKWTSWIWIVDCLLLIALAAFILWIARGG